MVAKDEKCMMQTENLSSYANIYAEQLYASDNYIQCIR